MKGLKNMTEEKGEILIYSSDDGVTKIDVRLEDETVWLTQQQLADLYHTSKSNVSEHITNIFKEGELDEAATVRKFRTVQMEGSRQVSREISHYNLDMIIAIGYRVRTPVGTQFRQWATARLKEYMVKGFTLDDERLKQGTTIFGHDYFRELLERVRSIRASERRIWQQITDIFAECSIDYDNTSEAARQFYAMVQNKFHYAITGQTAAEIVFDRADRAKEHMGLTTWKNAPDGRVLKSDVTVAKNYLDEKQIRQLERAVTGYFDYIEDLIERENTFTMQEFAASVNEFLSFRRYNILRDKGRVSAADAKKKAELEYDAFNKTQRIVSDFDKAVKRLSEKNQDTPQ